MRSAEAGPTALILFLVLALRLYRAVFDLGINLAELRFARETLGRIRALAAERPFPEADLAETPAETMASTD